MFLPHPRVKVSIVGSLRDREVACSASDRQGSNFESCVWRTVSSQSSHHPQEVLLAQFSLYVHKGGLKPDSFHFHDRDSAFSTSARTKMSGAQCHLIHAIGRDDRMPAQQTRDIEPMLGQCRADVVDVGPALTQHWFNVSCLLGEIWAKSLCARWSRIDNLCHPSQQTIIIVRVVTGEACVSSALCHNR